MISKFCILILVAGGGGANLRGATSTEKCSPTPVAPRSATRDSEERRRRRPDSDGTGRPHRWRRPELRRVTSADAGK